MILNFSLRKEEVANILAVGKIVFSERDWHPGNRLTGCCSSDLLFIDIFFLSERGLSLFLSQLAQGQRVVAGVHLVVGELGLSPLEVLDVLLQDPALVLNALLLVRNADLHVVKFGMKLEGWRLAKNNIFLYQIFYCKLLNASQGEDWQKK